MDRRHAFGGSSSTDAPPRDTTYHINLPPGMFDDEEEARPRREEQPGLIPVYHDDSGLIPVPEEEYPIPIVHPQPPLRQNLVVHNRSRPVKILSLYDVGLAVLKEITTKTPRGGMAHAGSMLAMEMSVLVVLTHGKKVPTEIKDAEYLARNVSMDARLTLFGAAESQWPEREDLPVPVMCVKSAKLKLVWPGYRVARVFSRLQRIKEEMPANQELHQELHRAQLLQLYFVDIIDSCESLKDSLHVDWNPDVWKRLRGTLTGEVGFGKSIKWISEVTAEQIEMMARDVESWVCAAILNRQGHIHSNMLRSNEITFRILRVCLLFRNVQIRIWRDPSISDPRRQLPEWQLASNGQGYPDSPMLREVTGDEEVATIPHRTYPTDSQKPYRPVDRRLKDALSGMFKKKRK